MSTKKISRREFLRTSSALVAGAVLASCASTPPEAGGEPSGQVEAPPVKEGVLLRYWSGWGGESYAKAWERIQETGEFKEALGNNQFEIKLAVEGEAMLTAVAGGDPPDTGTNIQYLAFIARGALRPIDDLVAASTKTKKDDFFLGNWDMGFYKGVMYGIPTQECFLRFGLNYNSKLVEQAGLDPDNPPQTWDEVFEWHQALTKFDGAGNLIQVGLNPYGAMGEGFWDSDGWMAPTSWGWNWFDENTAKFDLNNEKMVDAFRVQREFVKLAGVDNLDGLYTVEGRDTWGGAYNSEVEAMIIEGYWHPGETSSDKPEVAQYNRATWLPVPASRKGVKAQGSGGHLWTIFKDSKNPEAMFKIAEVLNTNSACAIIYESVGWLPAVKAYFDTVDPSTYPGLDFYFKSGDETTEWHFPARCEITDFASTEYLSLKDKVNRDELTPEQAAEEFQRRVEAEYKAAGFA